MSVWGTRPSHPSAPPLLMRHLTIALRVLRKSPFVSAVAVLSLALGIGANAAIFSLFDQLLLRSLPVPAPEGLISLSAPGPKPGSQTCNQQGDCETVFSYPMYRDLERAQTVLSGLVAHRLFGGSFAARDEPFTAEAVWASGSYFPTLGIQPALGRLLGPADDEVPGAHDVVVISHMLWMERFGGSPSVLGERFVANGVSYTIVGVTPEGFTGTTIGTRPIAWLPLSMSPNTGSPQPVFENRRRYWLYVFGRLRPGVTIAEASTALNTLYSPMLADVEAPLQEGMSDATMQRFLARRIVAEPGQRGQSDIHREAKTPLLMLFSVTGIVLLIACANVANLLLARGAGRATEMGVRLALGATRRHLVVQLLTEAVLLALLGGAASLLVAHWTLHLIGTLLPPDATNALTLTLQPLVVLFAALLAIGTGLVFGLFPALHSTRADLISAIRAGTSQMTGGKAAARFRTTLVTAQVALSMALLVSAGLFIKSLTNVSRVELGANIENLVTFGISPGRAGYDSTRSATVLARVEEELAALPGVTEVASATVPFLAGNNWGTDVRVQGFAHGPDVDANARLNLVGPGYLAAMGMTLLAGREFTDSDVLGATRVAIVNETFAAKFGLGRDAVGKFMNTDGRDSLNVQIVGLMKDAKYSDVKDPVPPLFFTPWRQAGNTTTLVYYVRSSLPAGQLLAAIPPLLRRLDPTIPVEELKTMPQQVRENVFLDRMISILSASFALLATLLAGIGLYGVLSYSVMQRTREIGVRMALGADAGRVRTLILRQVAIMVGVGGVIGVLAALGLGRAAQSLLFGLEGHDPLVFALSVLLLALVAVAAGYAPARRAAAVDPMQALRYD